jgi:hypothetical protein
MTQSPTNSIKKQPNKFGFIPKNSNSPQNIGLQIKTPLLSSEKPRRSGVNQPMGSNYIKPSLMKKSTDNIGTKKVENLQKMQQDNMQRRQ